MMTAAELLPCLRELVSRFPEYHRHEAWELQWLLFALGYTDELEDEGEIESAAQTARRDFDPDEAA